MFFILFSKEIILSRQKRYVKKKDTEKMILTQEERINFVQLHNNKRKEVEPSAANMIAMVREVIALRLCWIIRCLLLIYEKIYIYIYCEL